MPDQFVTLADLHRAGAALWVQCKGCGKINRLTPHTLTGGKGVFARPDLVTPEMDATIVETAVKLRCSSCGGREIEWTPMCNPWR